MINTSIRLHPSERRFIKFLLFVGGSIGICICLITTLLVMNVIPLSQLLEFDTGKQILLLLSALYGTTGLFILFCWYYNERLNVIGIDIRDNLLFCRNVFRSVSGPVGSLVEVNFTQQGKKNVVRFVWQYQSIGIGGSLCEIEQQIPYSTVRKSPREGMINLLRGLQILSIPVNDK